MDGFSHQLDELKALDYVNLANCLIKAYVKFLYCSYFLGEKFSIKQLGRAGLNSVHLSKPCASILNPNLMGRPRI